VPLPLVQLPIYFETPREEVYVIDTILKKKAGTALADPQSYQATDSAVNRGTGLRHVSNQRSPTTRVRAEHSNFLFFRKT
jgi:hypothetical protein